MLYDRYPEKNLRRNCLNECKLVGWSTSFYVLEKFPIPVQEISSRARQNATKSEDAHSRGTPILQVFAIK